MHQWFTEQDSLKHRLGLEFDARISESHPDTTCSLPHMHGGYCPICYEELTEETGFALACGHTFCGECWKDYLTTKVQAGADGIDALCQQVNCNMKVPHSVFIKHLTPSEEEKLDEESKEGENESGKILEMYWRWLCKSYTDDNKNV